MSKAPNQQTVRTQKKPNFSNIKRHDAQQAAPQQTLPKKFQPTKTVAKHTLNSTQKTQGNRIHYTPKPIPDKSPNIANRSGLRHTSNITTFKFSQAELEKLRHGFNEIDLDGNGRLDKYEMNTFLEKNGLDITFTDLAYQLFSHDGETLDFPEFQKYISITSQMDENPRVFYKALFDFIDKDKSGGIDDNELIEFCKLCKNPITKTEAKKAIRDLDDRHTGTIHFEELCKYLGV